MGLSLSTLLPPHLCGPAAVLLQIMKLPASLVGPYSHIREVKGDGTPPDGPRYQNRACKYYKLTSDNDGEAFRWTSNYQIISKVYLKKHSTLPLCYSLSAADKKMVTSTMKRMVGPEAE